MENEIDITMSSDEINKLLKYYEEKIDHFQMKYDQAKRVMKEIEESQYVKKLFQIEENQYFMCEEIQTRKERNNKDVKYGVGIFFYRTKRMFCLTKHEYYISVLKEFRTISFSNLNMFILDEIYGYLNDVNLVNNKK